MQKFWAPALVLLKMIIFRWWLHWIAIRSQARCYSLRHEFNNPVHRSGLIGFAKRDGACVILRLLLLLMRLVLGSSLLVRYERRS